MSAVERQLRRNNPAETRICIPLRDHEPSEEAVAQALEQNPFVTDITLDVDWVQRMDWNSLLRVIATRAILEKVKVLDSRWGGPRNTPAALIGSILRAIQQNTSIQSVGLWSVRLPTDVSTFVNTASSITSFSIYACDMEATEREQGTRALAAALQRNTNIETLKLSRLEGIYTVPIFEGLGSNISLKSFIFTPTTINATYISGATSHALQRLLESTTSIRRFELIELAACGEDTFHPIAQAITSSECVSELKFSRVGFQGRNSHAPLQSILLNKQNLTSLCLDSCAYDGGQVCGDIISILLRPDSPLRCFEFHGFLEEELPGIQFKNLLQAIQKSKLERFQIGSIGSHQQLQTLTRSIPSMKLKELETVFDHADEDEEEGEFGRETIRHDLFHAVKNNFSLRSVTARRFGFDLFDSAEDKETLAFYANRNESLDQWVDHPETVEKKVRPDALGLAERAGPDALFRGLHSVLESDYVSLPGCRKRKRPQYYAPT